MKKKNFLAVLLSMACMFSLAFTITSCDNSDNSSTSSASTSSSSTSSGSTSSASTSNSSTSSASTSSSSTSSSSTSSSSTSSSSTSSSSTSSSSTSSSSTSSSSTSGSIEPSETVGTDYRFEAEYTDLTNLTGDLGSGTAYGREMIKADNGASEGNYVENFNIKDSTVTYRITAAEATKANMSLLIRVASEDVCDSDLLLVEVNGNKVDFAAATITSDTQKVNAIKFNMLFTTFEIGEVSLNAGENIITFTVGEKPNASGTGTYKLSFGLDAMILSSSVSLTWNPITDWDNFYLDF